MWYRNLANFALLVEPMKTLRMNYPKRGFDPAEEVLD
jgi:hypothetical protein